VLKGHNFYLDKVIGKVHVFSYLLSINDHSTCTDISLSGCIHLCKVTIAALKLISSLHMCEPGWHLNDAPNVWLTYTRYSQKMNIACKNAKRI
jgi:hypothetical protein